MAVGPFMPTYFRQKVADFSPSLMFDFVGIFLARPRHQPNLAGFLQPFSSWVRLQQTYCQLGEASHIL